MYPEKSIVQNLSKRGYCIKDSYNQKEHTSLTNIELIIAILKGDYAPRITCAIPFLLAKSDINYSELINIALKNKISPNKLGYFLDITKTLAPNRAKQLENAIHTLESMKSNELQTIERRLYPTQKRRLKKHLEDRVADSYAQKWKVLSYGRLNTYKRLFELSKV